MNVSLLSLFLQVAHHYPTMHHLTQTHPHVWLPKRVGALHPLCYSLFTVCFYGCNCFILGG